MLQKLRDQIANCLQRALDAEHHAAMARDESIHAHLEAIAKNWRHLASSYRFIESLGRFLLDAEKARDAQVPKPPPEAEGSAQY